MNIRPGNQTSRPYLDHQSYPEVKNIRLPQPSEIRGPYKRYDLPKDTFTGSKTTGRKRQNPKRNKQNNSQNCRFKMPAVIATLLLAMGSVYACSKPTVETKKEETLEAYDEKTNREPSTYTYDYSQGQDVRLVRYEDSNGYVFNYDYEYAPATSSSSEKQTYILKTIIDEDYNHNGITNCRRIFMGDTLCETSNDIDEDGQMDRTERLYSPDIDHREITDYNADGSIKSYEVLPMKSDNTEE